SVNPECSFRLILLYTDSSLRELSSPFPTRRSSDLYNERSHRGHGVSTDIVEAGALAYLDVINRICRQTAGAPGEPAPAAETVVRSEEHTSELQSRENLVCRLLLEKKKSMVCSELFD